MKDYKIFYSWQSDTDKYTNSIAIRNVLRTSANRLENDMDNIRIIIDEATRDKPGAPDIPNTIFEKITSADIFICDITIINQSQLEFRKTPNPNVLLELGFAISEIGWDRIILLNNNFISNISDQPFDIKTRRISTFSIRNKNDNSGVGQLTVMLKTAIETIIQQNPPKSKNNIVLSTEEIKRNRDIKNLKWVLNQLHIPSIDVLIDELPYFVNNNVLFTYEGFKSVFNNSLFSLYDQKLNEIIKDFFNILSTALSYGSFYEPVSDSGKYKIVLNPLDPDEAKVINELQEIRIKVKTSLLALIDFVREKYIEIDINKSNEFAYEEFKKHSY